VDRGIKHVVPQITDDDLLYLRAERLDDISQQVVRHWPGRLDALQSAVNRKNLNDADHDGKTPLAVTLFQDNHLLVGHFIYDDTR